MVKAEIEQRFDPVRLFPRDTHTPQPHPRPGRGTRRALVATACLSSPPGWGSPADRGLRRCPSEPTPARPPSPPERLRKVGNPLSFTPPEPLSQHSPHPQQAPATPTRQDSAKPPRHPHPAAHRGAARPSWRRAQPRVPSRSPLGAVALAASWGRWPMRRRGGQGRLCLNSAAAAGGGCSAVRR